MAKKDWSTCTDPVRMMRAFRNQASERRLRLLVCGLARKTWIGRPDDRIRKAVEVAELFADDEATPHELSSAQNGALKAYAVATFNTRLAAELAYLSTQMAANVTEGSNRKAIRFAAQFSAQVVHKTIAVELLRCVCGALIDQPAPLDPAVLTWYGSLLVSMARRMYDARDFADLPILADALEDAGCTRADILTHCLQPGEHVRGCWVIDLLLGKK